MLESAPSRLVERRLRHLDAHLQQAKSGTIEGIHQARIASRRLREVLPILPPNGSYTLACQVRRDVRLITRSLGPVRELDVSMQLMNGFSPDADLAARALEWIKRVLWNERSDAFARMLLTVNEIEYGRVRAAALAMAGGLLGRPALRRCRMLLAERVAARALALDAALDGCRHLI